MKRLANYIWGRCAITLTVMLLCCRGLVMAQKEPPESFPGFTNITHLGWTNSGTFVMEIRRLAITNSSPTNSGFFQFHHKNMVVTNLAFTGYRPESLGNAIWTNFIAHTNGRDMAVWSERVFPRAATDIYQARWNTNSLMWGMKGLTALGPNCEFDLGSGQSPFTALTRRHGYTRGHSAGEEGFNKSGSGKKIWFVTTANSIVEVKVVRRVCRTRAQGGDADYTIVLFDHDLPTTIEPIRVTSFDLIQSHYPFPSDERIPHPIFMTEQAGYLSTGVRPFITDVVKGGDSGCPNLLPMPGELVFFGGRTTTGPTPRMQADMDELCRLEKLNPRKYQLQWFDLSKYPAY